MPQTYSFIASATVGAGGAASIDFTSIPQTYTDLVVLCSLRENGSATIRSSVIRFNGDSSTVYDNKLIDGNGSAASTASGTLNAIIWAVQNDTNSTGGTFSNVSLYIPNYTNSSRWHPVDIEAVAENNATTAINRLTGVVYKVATAINRVTIYGEASNLVQYSTAYLYGIKNS